MKSRQAQKLEYVQTQYAPLLVSKNTAGEIEMSEMDEFNVQYHTYYMSTAQAQALIEALQKVVGEA